MMGASHAATGAAGWLVITGPGAHLVGMSPAEPQVMLIGALTTAGAALISDWDHPKASIAYALPPVTNLIAAGIQKIAGGHRAGTHSLLGLLIFTALTVAVMPARIEWNGQALSLGQGVVAAFLTAVAAKTLRVIPRNGYLSSWAVGLGVGALAAGTAPGAWWWLPSSVFLGVLLHIIGDGLTVQGVPLLWPHTPRPAVPSPFWLANGRFAAPLVGRTGSLREWVLITPISLYVLVAMGQIGLELLLDLSELSALAGQLR